MEVFDFNPAFPLLTSAAREILYERPAATHMTRWVAASLLQKAIRRSETTYALQAASDLLKQDPKRFWRRCMVIAAEEIGIADLCLVSDTVRDSRLGKSMRCQDEVWALASGLVVRMCKARKCRASDDLAVAAEYDPELEDARCSMAERNCHELIEFALSDQPIARRAVALWAALGAPWSGFYKSTTPNHRKRQNAVLSWLYEERAPDASIEVACAGFQETREIIFPLLLILAPHARTAVAAELVDDCFPEAIEIGKCPSWALDGFTREGRKAIAAFMKADCYAAEWVRSHVPAAERIDFVSGLLFRIESGLVSGRSSWGGAAELRARADRFSHGPRCRDALDLLLVFRSDLSVLNDARRRAVEGSNAR